MQVVTRGSGAPLLLVTGLQGRWEYMRPAVDALARTFQVITFPLRGERSSGLRLDPALGLDNYVEQIALALDHVQVDRAVICGISFGGLAALRFAATHPDRTAALILASTPGPGWHLRPRHRLYARLPWLLGPLFLFETPFRLHPEVATALPRLADRWRFMLSQLHALVTAPVSLRRMAERAELLDRPDVGADASRVSAPTLIVTGERALDWVVPVDGSRGYAATIRGARLAVLDRTGHLGTVTHPDQFAALVTEFVGHTSHAGAAA